MDCYEEIYKSICRICLKYDNNKNMVSLINDNSENIVNNYGKAVLTFTNITIRKQDYLPTFMCAKCLYLLKQAIYFKLLCESSETHLKKLAESVKKEKLKEHIVEYTMFRYYFPNECFKENKKRKIKKRCRSRKCDINNKVNENIDSTNITTENDYNETESLTDDLTEDYKILDKMESLIDTSAYKSLESENLIKVAIKSKHKTRNHLILKNRLDYKKEVEKTSLVCNICKKVLRNQLTYKHHMQRHNGCRYCINF